LGQGQLIPGFERGLIDMEVGETKTIEIEPQDAYGNPNEEMYQEVEKTVLPEDIFEGMMLQANGPQGVFNVLVKEIKETTAVLDANHPLAGKKLFFDLEVVEVM
jgi:FKBP-type peptidyl-prolyl cis-trans isomerase SlpA